MRKLLCFLLSLILLIFSNTIVFASEPKISDKLYGDSEVQSLVESLRELRKQERTLLDEVVSKRHTIRASLEGKDDGSKKSIESYSTQMDSINQSMKQVKEKKILSWTELKKARENNDLAKMKLELKNLITLEKQTIEKTKMKISVLDLMIIAINK